MSKLFESRAAVLEHEARARVLEKEIELAKLKASQRTWAGLADEERMDILLNLNWDKKLSYMDTALAIESKLKEKNT
jgi:hypothetical protein